MTRQEFLDELRFALQGNISQAQVNEHLRYYDNYIMEESRKGKSEQQVIQELGNPRLIARTLIETDGIKTEPQNRHPYSDQYQENEDGRPFNIGCGYSIFLFVILAIIVIVLISRLVMLLLPIILGAVLLFFIYKWITGNRR